MKRWQIALVALSLLFASPVWAFQATTGGPGTAGAPGPAGPTGPAGPAPTGSPPQFVGYSAANTVESETLSGCTFSRTGTNAYSIACTSAAFGTALDLSVPPPIGGATPNAGTFTTLASSAGATTSTGFGAALNLSTYAGVIGSSATGSPALAMTNFTGTQPTGTTAALTGDVTKSAGSNATTYASDTNAVFDAGTIGSAGTAACNMSGARICKMTAGAGNWTIGIPTNMAVNQVYWLEVKSTANRTVTMVAGWNYNAPDASGVLGAGVWNSGNSTSLIPFIYDGTNPVATTNPWGGFMSLRAQSLATSNGIANGGGNITGGAGAITTTTGKVGTTGGGAIQVTGGTLPTVTGGCGSGNANTGSTNNRGSVTTGTAETTCSVVFSASGVWAQAPFCLCGDGGGSATPLGCAISAQTTSGMTMTFAAATSRTFNYMCM